MINDREIGYHRLMALSRFDQEDFLGPVVRVEKDKEEEPVSGYTLKLDLSQYEHDRLIAVLKKESYDPAIKKILYDIIGYDQAVEESKRIAAMYEKAYAEREAIESVGRELSTP